MVLASFFKNDTNMQVTFRNSTPTLSTFIPRYKYIFAMSVFCPRRESAPSGRIVNYSKTAGAGGGVAVGEDVSAVRPRRWRRGGGGGQLPRCSLLPSLHVLLPLRRAAAVAGLGAAARLSVITSSTGVHSGVQRTHTSSTPEQYRVPTPPGASTHAAPRVTRRRVAAR